MTIKFKDIDRLIFQLQLIIKEVRRMKPPALTGDSAFAEGYMKGYEAALKDVGESLIQHTKEWNKKLLGDRERK